MTSLVAAPRSSSKALPKAKLAPKKGYDHCLAICCLSGPLQLSESWWNHYTWEVCSVNQWDALTAPTPAANWSTERPQFFRTTPGAHHTSSTSKAQRIAWPSFAHLPSSTDLLPRLPLLQVSWQLFAGKMLPQPGGGRKCFPRVHWIPKHGFLCYGNKPIYFSLAKMCWL